MATMRDFLSVKGQNLIRMGKQRGDNGGIELDTGLLFKIAEDLAYIPGVLVGSFRGKRVQHIESTAA